MRASVSFCSSLGAVLVVGAHLALALELAQVVHHVTADVSHGHSPLLGDAVHDLDELAAALLGQLGICSRMT